MAIEIWVNIGSDIDLLPTSTKPLREVEKFGLELLAIMIVSAQQHSVRNQPFKSAPIWRQHV